MVLSKKVQLCKNDSVFLLPPATKLGQGYVFTRICDSVHRGGLPDIPPGADNPQTRYTPWEQTPPQTRYTPLGADTPMDQVHPPRTNTPQSRHPLEQTCPYGADTPLRADTPQADTPPSRPPPGPSTSPGSRHPPDKVHPPRADTPPGSRHPPWRRACWEIRSTRVRYASYWNAILFVFFLYLWRFRPR